MASRVKANLIRAAAFGFIAFLIAVVVIADRGDGSQWWPFLRNIPFGDKIGHIGLFGTLCFLCNLAFPSRRIGHRPLLITKTTLVLLAIISLEELSQIFIPFRTFDSVDWLADILGLAAGQTAAYLCTRVFRKANVPDELIH